MVKEGSKISGRYDAIVMAEGKDEKIAMKTLLRWGDKVISQSNVSFRRL